LKSRPSPLSPPTPGGGEAHGTVGVAVNKHFLKLKSKNYSYVS
jgi:hypothetical protein